MINKRRYTPTEQEIKDCLYVEYCDNGMADMLRAGGVPEENVVKAIAILKADYDAREQQRVDAAKQFVNQIKTRGLAPHSVNYWHTTNRSM